MVGSAVANENNYFYLHNDSPRQLNIIVNQPLIVYHFKSIVSKLAAIILLATGLLKILDSTVRADYFDQPDSVFFFLSNRQMMLIAAALEIGVAVYIWFAPSIKHRGIALLWLCSSFVLYKIGSEKTFATKPCSCLGILGKWLKLSNHQLEVITWSLLFTMIAMAIIILIGSSHKLEKGRLI